MPDFLDPKKIEEVQMDIARLLMCFDLKTVARMLRCGKVHASQLCRDGKIEAFYLGKEIRVPAFGLIEFMNNKRGEFLMMHKRKSDRMRGLIDLEAHVQKVNDMRKRKRGAFKPPEETANQIAA